MAYFDSGVIIKMIHDSFKNRAILLLDILQRNNN